MICNAILVLAQRMRRPRRHRWLTVSVFFIAYSVFQAVFSASITPETAELDKELGETPAYEFTSPGSKTEEPREETKKTTPAGADVKESEEESSAEGDKKKMKGLVDEEEDKKTQKDAGYNEDEEMTKLREGERILLMKSFIPTVHPLRENCTPPAIEQFPPPLMGQNARKHGGLIIHVLVCAFTFIGLAIVSDWWPLCRDCFFYALSILVLLCTICNGYVSWPEALFMLFMYGVYCVALRYNTQLERWAMMLPLPIKLPTREEQAALVTYKYATQRSSMPSYHYTPALLVLLQHAALCHPTTIHQLS
ncbi:putative potassium-dependent sodium-calcium exchanger [Operophtera brumata]|uniref:Putative potassium-dependent sodium-calcium exchanger n=1 Tax=Operophtera brumata TaxID=104452 RepID=A0A0L7KHT2_OPEBR|nr:putative potassium-dependent sodium-calcium exchanger [Operophtera brumata]